MNDLLDDAGPSPEDLFAAFLEEVEAGQHPDFDTFCAAHPAFENSLRGLHRQWSAMTQAFAALSAGGGRAPIELASASVEALLTSLGADAGRRHRYAIGAEIAAGAMGRVVGAWDRELRREVALKIHRGDGGARQLRRFLEEAQIAGQLDHPGIVPIHELGLDDDGRPFFAMRLVRGRELGAVLELARTGAEGWSRTRVLHVLLRVCEAMAYAHSKGVVHRDLKPGNVMVGRFGEVYVMDWGLARVTGDAGSDLSIAEDRRSTAALDSLRATIEAEDGASALLTQHGEVVGTPAYMAPELALGSAAMVSPAADVYSVGAILHQLCAGRLPYVGDGEVLHSAEVLARLRRGPPQSLPAEVPVELRAICERAMARDPAVRYPGMAELAEELRAYLDLRVVRSHARGPWAELRKWIERNRALALALGFAALILIAGVIVSTRLWVAADDAAAQLDRELARSEFRNARLSLELEDAASAEDQLWRQHFNGAVPRATHWALVELHARSPILASVPPPSGEECPIAVARHSGEIAIGCEDGSVRVFGDDLVERRRFAASTTVVRSIAIDPSGRRLLAGSQDGSLVIFDFADGRALRREQAHANELRGLAIAADGQRFATGGGDGQVLIWDGFGAAPRAVTSHGTTAIWSLAFDAAEQRLASGGSQGDLRITDLVDGRVAALKLGDRELMALSFAPQADELWVGSATHSVFVLRSAPLGLLRTVPTRNGSCRDLAHQPDGDVLVGGWWRVDRYRADAVRAGPVALRGVWQFDVDPGRQRVALSSPVRGLSLIDRSARGRQQLTAHAAAMSADGRSLAIADRDGVWVSVVGAAPSDRRRITAGPASRLAIDPRGLRLALQRRDGAPVEIYDSASGERLFEVDGPTEPPFDESFAFSPDGAQIAVVAGWWSVRRFALPDGALLGRDDVGPHQVLRLRWAADASTLAVVLRQERSVRLLSTGSGAVRLVDCGESPAVVALSHDGSRLAIGSWQGTLAVKDLESGGIRRLHAHAGTIFGLRFAPNDANLLISSGGADGVTFWDLEHGVACLNVLRENAPVSSLSISDDARTLAVRNVAGAVLLDLEYYDRHIAGNLAQQLERLRDEVDLSPAREAELRRWAADVLARPWPRWASR